MRRGFLTMAWLGAAMACLSVATSCTPKARSDKKLDPALEQYIVTRLPDTLQHETYLDFEGKVQLLGYDVSPDEVAPPGSKVSLTLYWQRTGKLDAGWGLFTHILDENGRQIAQRDSSGPLRRDTGNGQALGPSDWEIGKIYVDQLSIDIPRTQGDGEDQGPLRTPVITLAVGVWKDMARLDVLGGTSDAHRRGFVTSLKTGVERAAFAEDTDEEAEKASDG